MNLVDIRQVVTQILGFLLMVWILRRYAWGPVMSMLEARREKIAGEIKAPVEKKDAVDVVSGINQPYTLKNSRWVREEDRER